MKVETDRNSNGLRDFLGTDQLNVAVFIVMDLSTVHQTLQLTPLINSYYNQTLLLLPLLLHQTTGIFFILRQSNDKLYYP